MKNTVRRPLLGSGLLKAALCVFARTEGRGGDGSGNKLDSLEKTPTAALTDSHSPSEPSAPAVSDGLVSQRRLYHFFFSLIHPLTLQSGPFIPNAYQAISQLRLVDQLLTINIFLWLSAKSLNTGKKTKASSVCDVDAEQRAWSACFCFFSSNWPFRGLFWLRCR